MLLFFGIIGIFGYSYMNDIKEQKGRHYRKIFESKLPTNTEVLSARRYAVDRIKAHDPEFEKFTHPKERAQVHHHWSSAII